MTSLPVPDDLVDLVAERLAEKLAELLPNRPEPWLDVAAAAEYLSAPKSRVYDLIAEGRLRHARDGRRVLTRREWLDEVLEEAAR